MSLDPAREQAAWEIARSRKFTVKSLDNGQWLVVDTRGGAVSPVEQGDPVEAVEEAERVTVLAEQREASTRARRLFDALAMGVYMPWPGPTNPQGEFNWFVLRTADRSVVAGPFPGLLGACIEIATRVNQPPAPGG